MPPRLRQHATRQQPSAGDQGALLRRRGPSLPRRPYGGREPMHVVLPVRRRRGGRVPSGGPAARRRGGLHPVMEMCGQPVLGAGGGWWPEVSARVMARSRSQCGAGAGTTSSPSARGRLALTTASVGSSHLSRADSLLAQSAIDLAPAHRGNSPSKASATGGGRSQRLPRCRVGTRDAAWDAAGVDSSGVWRDHQRSRWRWSRGGPMLLARGWSHRTGKREAPASSIRESVGRAARRPSPPSGRLRPATPSTGRGRPSAAPSSACPPRSSRSGQVLRRRVAGG